MKEQKPLTDEEIFKKYDSGQSLLERVWNDDYADERFHEEIDEDKVMELIKEVRRTTISEVVKKIEKRKDELCLLFDKNDDRLQKDNFKTDMAREFVESTQEAIGTRLDELNKLKKALCSQKPELESEKEVNSASLSCIAASAGEKQGADGCFKYKCGHSSTAILMDNNPLSYTAYLEWSRWLRYIRIGGT